MSEEMKMVQRGNSLADLAELEKLLATDGWFVMKAAAERGHGLEYRYELTVIAVTHR